MYAGPIADICIVGTVFRHFIILNTYFPAQLISKPCTDSPTTDITRQRTHWHEEMPHNGRQIR